MNVLEELVRDAPAFRSLDVLQRQEIVQAGGQRVVSPLMGLPPLMRSV
jgi:hypothetical protein